jgi:hypothetical protein
VKLKTVLQLSYFIGVLSGFAYSQVNPITGQAAYSLTLFPGITMQYSGDMALKANTRNDQFAVGWCGLGWKLGTPSIGVVHNNTVDMNDDRWLYNDGYDNISEIIRVFEGSNPVVENFYIKNNPYVRVVPTFSANAVRIIKGWTMTGTDGTISHFGQAESETATDALRYVPSWNGVILRQASVASTTPFYYRWDLKDVITVEGKKTVYTYQQSNVTNLWGQTYTRESYIHTITDPIHRVTTFTLDAGVKSDNELPTVSSSVDFNFIETRFLRTITQTNSSGNIVERVDLGYSGDAGETVQHLYSTSKGFAKRLLAHVKFTTNRANNHDFTYYTVEESDYTQSIYPGYIHFISQPMIGKTLTYSYKDLKGAGMGANSTKDTFGLVFPTAEFNGTNGNCYTNVINTGNHIFVLDNHDETYNDPNNYGVKIEILDKVRFEWKNSEMFKLYGNNFLPRCRCYPWLDRYVLITKNPQYDGTPRDYTVDIFEWIDDRWQNTLFGFEILKIAGDWDPGLSVNDMQVLQTNSNIMIFVRATQIIYVLRKIKGAWKSTFNAPGGYNNIYGDGGHDLDGNGWGWPKQLWLDTSITRPLVALSENYFIYSQIYSFPNCVDWPWHRVLETFVWQGDENNDGVKTSPTEWWVQTFVPALDGPVFGPGSITQVSRTYLTNNDYTYSFSDFVQHCSFETPEPPYGLNDFPHIWAYNDYYAVFSPQHYGYAPVHGGGSLAIRKYDAYTKNWVNVGVQLASGGPDGFQDNLQLGFIWTPKIYSGQDYFVFLFSNNSGLIKRYPCVYRKLPDQQTFQLSSIVPIPGCGAVSDVSWASKHCDVDVDKIIAGPDQFLAINKTPGYIWDFRGSGTNNEWVSVLNGLNSQTRDAVCQGIKQNYAIDTVNVYAVDGALSYYFNNANNEKRSVRYFDFLQNAFNIYNDVNIAYDKDHNRFGVSGNSWALLIDNFNSSNQQGVIIENHCPFTWSWVLSRTVGFPNTVVARVTASGGVSNAPDEPTKYGYVQNVTDIGSGASFFKRIFNQQGSGATGVSETEYSIDSAAELFGTIQNQFNYSHRKIIIKGKIFSYDGHSLYGTVYISRKATIQDPPGSTMINGDPCIPTSGMGPDAGSFTVECDAPFGTDYFELKNRIIEGPNQIEYVVFSVNVSSQPTVSWKEQTIQGFTYIAVTKSAPVTGDPFTWIINNSMKFGCDQVCEVLNNFDPTHNDKNDTYLVSRTTQTWQSRSIHFFEHFADRTLSIPRLIMTETMRDKVVSFSENLASSYNSDNGLPTTTITVNSDGKSLVKRNTFAYKIWTSNQPLYPDMQKSENGKCMLTQIAESDVFAYNPNELFLKIADADAGPYTIDNTNPFEIPLWQDLTSASGISAKSLIQLVFKMNFPDKRRRTSVKFNLKFYFNTPGHTPVEVDFDSETGTSFYGDPNSTTVTDNSKLVFSKDLFHVLFDYYSDIQKISLVIRGNDLNQSTITFLTSSNKCKLIKNPYDIDKIVSSAVTTWPTIQGIPRPNESYIWNSSMDANGRPTKTWVYFLFENPHSEDNRDWDLAGTNERFDDFGNVVQFKKHGPKATCQATIFRNDCSLPIGKIANANFYESGIFTCDYDLRESGSPYNYFDKQNGWEKHYGVVVGSSEDLVHFGQRSVEILNGEGIMRNFKIRPNTKYELSAWAYVADRPNSCFQLWAELRTGAPPQSDWPVPYTALPDFTETYTSDPLSTTNGQWKLVKVTIPAQPIPQVGNEIWIRTTVGRNGATFYAYVDDVRFGPSNSLISTTYYDALWQQPILSVGPDNNPGDLVEYDNFGRPSLTFKFSKNTCDLTVKSVKSYHLMNETPLFDPNTSYKIVTRVDNTIGVEPLNGSSGISEHQLLQLNQISQPPQNYQLWKFIAVGDGNYCIQNQKNTSFYIDDPYRTIVNGSQLKMWDGMTNNQKWNIVPLNDGTYRITSFASGAKSMEYDAPGGQAPAPGTPVQIWSYKNFDNQKWVIRAVQ